jgi:RHS repeat-associated protein
MTDASGAVCFDADYYPYGSEVDYNTNCNTSYKFTGYERDPETGLDYAFARYYNSRLGGS